MKIYDFRFFSQNLFSILELLETEDKVIIEKMNGKTYEIKMIPLNQSNTPFQEPLKNPVP